MTDTKPRTWLMGTLIGVMSLVALGPVCVADFTNWDDNYTIVNNPNLNPPSWSGVMSYWRQPFMALYVPVTYMTWGGLAEVAQLRERDAQGSRLNPWVFHTANWIVHFGSALIVLRILLLLVKHDGAACVGAILFAVHPVQVEPVAWASGMKDVLCGLLSLAALWQYLLAIGTANSETGPGAGAAGAKMLVAARWHYAAATVLFGLAMLAKPSAVMLPALAFVIDYFLVQRPALRVLRSIGLWVLLAVPCLIWTRFFQRALEVPASPLWARPLVAADSLGFYLYKLVFPGWLSIDYGRTPAVILQSRWIYVTWVLPLAMAMLLWRYRRARYLVAGALIFMLAPLPVLGLTRFAFQYYSTVADHYLYVAMLGPALALAWFASRHWTAGWRIGIALVLLALAVRSTVQSLTWQDNLSLFEHTLAVNPRSFMALTNLGVALKQTDPQRAENCFAAAVDIDPNYLYARGNLAESLMRRGERQGAFVQIEEAMKINDRLPPEKRLNTPELHNLRGTILMARGSYGPAAEEFAEALRLKPDYAVAAKNRELALQKLNGP